MDALLRRHYDRIFALCRRVTGSDADGADAAQEALIAIVRGLPRFDGRAQFSTWVYRVATNVCLDELRRQRRRPVPGLGDGRRSGRGRPDGRRPSARRSASAIASTSMRHSRTLPPDFRAAVVLRDVCQLDYAEISQVLGIPPGTVRSRIARGRAAAAAALAGNPDPPTRRPTG